ncbi:hypothetical protein DL765_007222 [Monosporascus sp. GIB2]|nr:hypothetical protein DL765_007222 [Monosporascus sp. GIB2]
MAEGPNKICAMSPTPKVEPRTEFLPLHCKVTAYPSVGGIVLGYFTAVQLKQLHLSNIESATRSQDDSEEDKLAFSMMRHGAHWWPSWQFYLHHYEQMTEKRIPYDFHFPPRINTGYPSSGKGVWVSKFSEDTRDWYQEEWIKPYLDRMHQIEAEDCDDIPKTLQEGFQMGKRYQALLEKMDDEGYLNHWLEDGIADDVVES